MRWPRSTPGSLGIYGKALGPEHPAVATLLNNLGQVEKAEGRYADAEPPIKRSLAIREKVLGRDHPDVARSLNNLADLFERQRHYADAEPLYQRAVAIRERALGSDHPDLWTSLNNLAFLYQAVGRTPDALPLVERHRQRTRAAARCPSGVIGRAAAAIDAGRTSIGRCAQCGSARWRASGFDWKPLSRKSPAFRRSPDVDKIGNGNVGSGNAGPFDLALANELYATVLGPVEQLVKDQRGLQVVPSGALTALPFRPAVWGPCVDRRGGGPIGRECAPQHLRYGG
jgi:hypothetical protein